MGTINPAIPTIGQPNSTEDADIRNGMITIRDEINGNLDNDNIKSAANILGSKLATNSVAPSKLTNGTAGQLLIANGSGVVTSTTVTGDVTINSSGVTQIGAGTVGTTEIADNSINHDKMTNNSVNTDELHNSAVTTAKIADDAVTADKIADNAVVTAGISNNTITAAKIKADAWTSYTPTWTAISTNPSLGNGTLTGHYIQLGKIVFFRIKLTFGSTTTAGNGSWSLTLPTNHAHPDYSPIGDIVLLDSSEVAFSIGTAMTTISALGGGADKFVSYYQTASGTNASSVGSSNPFAWANNDTYSITGTYEAA